MNHPCNRYQAVFPFCYSNENQPGNKARLTLTQETWGCTGQRSQDTWLSLRLDSLLEALPSDACYNYTEINSPKSNYECTTVISFSQWHQKNFNSYMASMNMNCLGGYHGRFRINTGSLNVWSDSLLMLLIVITKVPSDWHGSWSLSSQFGGIPWSPSPCSGSGDPSTSLPTLGLSSLNWGDGVSSPRERGGRGELWFS